MKVVAKTGEYTVYKKRNERFAVKGANQRFINGDAKVAILLEHKLIEAPKVKAPAAAEETAPAAAEETAPAAAEEAPAAEETAAAEPAADEAVPKAE